MQPVLPTWLLGRLRPDVVFSKGGFVSFPVVFAAWARRIPVVAHESDLTPGLANRLAMPFVRTLCVSFAATPTGRFAGKVVIQSGGKGAGQAAHLMPHHNRRKSACGRRDR